MNGKPSVAILGAGVSGVTTGVILNLADYDTTIYADHLPTWFAYEQNHPELSSLYAAASVQPHAVTTPHLRRYLEHSRTFFDRLTQLPGFSVRPQRHYELFEDPPPGLPSYLQTFRNTAEIPPEQPPVRRDPEIPVSGWAYDTYLVEMPRYMQEMLDFYRRTGGTVIETRLTRESFLGRDEDLLVNCGGLQGRTLFDDPASYRITRGYLTYVKIPPTDRPQTWSRFSYNYMPTTDIYCQPDGRPADVYFYPREDCWVLGGSRHIVESSDRTVEPEKYPERMTIKGIEVPAPLIRLNRDLLYPVTGVDITDYPTSASFGYRFERDPVRLEASEENGRLVLHNYGHGGAGVALSWGCAIEVLEMIEDHT